MIAQYGVMACREAEGGGRQVLLITSRETKRWVIPRGNPIAGLSPAEAAAQEAWEEAGIKGETGTEAIGAYRYDKRRLDGSFVPAQVQVFAMRVAEEADKWPEAKERERRWFTPAEAAEAVDEPDLKALLGKIAQEGA
jgi:8-oxo-dGTP pyrophosphatase MutT (NUDIX family)